MKWKYAIGIIALAGIALTLKSCSVSIPKGAKAVKPFDKKKYLGKWFEIARLDFKWERNLNNVTANYTLKPDGSIKVDNKGYNYLKYEWKQSIGTAKFVGSEEEARLKVAFFKPFYAGYNVIAIDNDYKYALVAGNNLKYLWILSRETSIPEDIKTSYLKKAQEIGYDTDQLIWVEHSM